MLERLPALVTSRGYKLLVVSLVLLLLALGSLSLYCYLASGAAILLPAAIFDFATAAVLAASLSLAKRVEEYRRILWARLAHLGSRH